MLHLAHVDAVVVRVGPDPFDPDDGLLEIDRRHEAIVVALDVEDDTVGCDYARRPVQSLDVRRFARESSFSASRNPSRKNS
jgi:hypothetical protein